jgi:fermentation-respiration switch protein FrsA (DUF1100 family)
MSPAAIGDAARLARLLGEVDGVDPDRVCLRGSSMGGFVAIHSAAVEEAVRGVIAICPAGEEMLLDGLKRESLEMRADARALGAWLEEHDLREAVAMVAPKPLIILHARGDDRIPASWSEELYERAGEPRKLVVIGGGHHRSVQHDPELGAVALRWLERSLGA